MPEAPRRWWRPSRRTHPYVDPALQAERTAMAWQRTALGVGAIGALLLHHTGGRSLAAIPGVLGLLVALGLIAATEHRYVQTVRRVRAGRPPTSIVLVRTLASVTVLLAAAAVVLVVFETG